MIKMRIVCPKQTQIQVNNHKMVVPGLPRSVERISCFLIFSEKILVFYSNALGDLTFFSNSLNNSKEHLVKARAQIHYFFESPSP